MNEYQAGAVWSGLIDFKDGDGERKKFFVLLSDCDQSGALALACFTTSKGDNRYGAAARSGSPCSSAAPCFRIDRNQEKCFPIDTWVQFDNCGYHSRASLDELKSSGWECVQTLSADHVRALLNCAKKSYDVKLKDKACIDAALKARTPTKKPAPAKPTTPTTPPAFVSIEILAISVRVGRYCVGCRADFAGMIPISDGDLTDVLHGRKTAGSGFATEALAALELLADQHVKCPKCTKSP